MKDNEKTEDWLKKSDAIIIECDDDVVNEYSLVYISPYNTKTKEWLINLKKEVLMKEALKNKKRLIAKGENVLKFLRELIKSQKLKANKNNQNN